MSISSCGENIVDVDITLMTLRKPTDLKKVIDSVPKPRKAVPKNGLPVWHKLSVESKLPVPDLPVGKIVFSRGKLGEDFRRIRRGRPQPHFDLTDPYCNNSPPYSYVSLHDPHLAYHFAQEFYRKRMQELGFCTKDGRAICTLKEFNQYRRHLYNQYMDRIHVEMAKLDERAKDDLTIKRVNLEVARRMETFTREEKAREHLEKVAQEKADESEERRRKAINHEKKMNEKIANLTAFREQQRKDRVAKAAEKDLKIKHRLKLANEMLMIRKLAMMRRWRTYENNRIIRQKNERDMKQRQNEKEANEKWKKRIEAQNAEIQKEALLLKIYSEDMTAGAQRRQKKAEIYAYNTNLALQRIKFENWKSKHAAKSAKLVRNMATQFEKSKRGTKGITYELAQSLAKEALTNACAAKGDPLMMLGQARAQMNNAVALHAVPVKLLDEILERAILEFSRYRVHLLLRDIERGVRSHAASFLFRNKRPPSESGNRPAVSRPKHPRWSVQVTRELARQYADARNVSSIAFGGAIDIPVKIGSNDEIAGELKSIKDRPPTPVPSLTKLAEVTFSDRIEDLPDPVIIGAFLPERKKLLEMVNAAAKILSKSVSQRVQKGMDVATGKITLPPLKHTMEWGEAVEGLTLAVADNRINPDCADLRRAAELLAYRILKDLLAEIKKEKEDAKKLSMSDHDDQTKIDFYIPVKD